MAETVLGELLTSKQVAERLHMRKQTLEAWRLQGKGPRFTKLGKLVRYREEDISAFIEEGMRQSTSESTTPSPAYASAKPGKAKGRAQA